MFPASGSGRLTTATHALWGTDRESKSDGRSTGMPIYRVTMGSSMLASSSGRRCRDRISTISPFGPDTSFRSHYTRKSGLDDVTSLGPDVRAVFAWELPREPDPPTCHAPLTRLNSPEDEEAANPIKSILLPFSVALLFGS